MKPALRRLRLWEASRMSEVAVIFRRWQYSGGVIALFPELPVDHDGWLCTSYEHVGQHAAADYHGVVARTVPATASEREALRRELSQVGYVLRFIRRASGRHHRRRRIEARRLRSTDTR